MTTPLAEDAPKDIVDRDKPPTVPTLTLQDRCDRCGAQAFVRTEILSGDGHPTSLLWCGHHFATHEDKLLALALAIQDERGRINEKSTSSA